MIGRWLRIGTSGFLYVCVATLLSQAILAGYLWSTWQLNRDKVIQMLAIAQGIDLFADRHTGPPLEGEIPPEEPSLDDWRERRATLFRDVELREQALDDARTRLLFEQRQLADAQELNQRIQDDFEARLLALKEGAEAEGRQTVGRILETIKPKQAKEQIAQMLDDGEMDEVVIILGAMIEAKRAKILAEFKTPDENARIAEVLRRIRQGEPASSMADETLARLGGRQATGG